MTIKKAVEKLLGFEVIEISGNQLSNLAVVDTIAVNDEIDLSVESLNQEGYYYATKLEEGEFLGYYRAKDDLKALEEDYREWRKISEEMIADGIPGNIDAGIESNREDFTNYIEADVEITFEEMLFLEKNF